MLHMKLSYQLMTVYADILANRLKMYHINVQYVVDGWNI